MSGSICRQFIRLVYTQNPFYLISVGFVLYGIGFVFHSIEDRESISSLLAVALMAYAALALTTAVLLIRFGKCWEDARSLFLIILIQLLALSMLFDELWNTAPWLACQIGSVGFLFSILLSEATMFLTRILLPIRFRCACYGLLALMFGYPILVSGEVWQLPSSSLSHRIDVFPTVAAGLVLLFFPTAWLGSASKEKNGTPWRWPWIPWSMFAVLLVGLVLRFYSMRISMVAAYRIDDGMGLWQLLPLIGVLGILLFEIGRVERRMFVQQVALLTCGLVPILAMAGTSSNFGSSSLFLTMLNAIGSPLWLSTVFLVIACLWGDWCRVRLAEVGATCGLMALTCVERTELAWTMPDQLIGWPLGILALLQAMRSLQTGQSFRYLISIGALGIFLCLRIGLASIWDWPYLMGMSIGIACLSVAFWFEDTFAQLLRGCLKVGFLALCASSVPIVFCMDAPNVFVTLLLLVSCIAMSSAFWLRYGELTWMLNQIVGALSVLTILGFAMLRRLDEAAGNQASLTIATGMMFFSLGVVVSITKVGLLSRGYQQLRRRSQGIQRRRQGA